MSEVVNAWKQKGRVFIWRYPPHKKTHEGWHLTAEDDACDSLIELLNAMRSTPRSSRRTVTISKPTARIWGVPNFGEPRREALGPLTILFDPQFSDLTLMEQNDRLLLRVGGARAEDLMTGLRDVRRGRGDYAFRPTERGVSPPIWFWWMIFGDGYRQSQVRRDRAQQVSGNNSE